MQIYGHMFINVRFNIFIFYHLCFTVVHFYPSILQ